MQTETTATNTVDTNEEYIHSSNAQKQPAVLASVFRYIFWETPKDFFGGILGFFARYFKHFADGIKYFWKPCLQVPPFDDKDFKEDCQRTFELSLIVTAFVIFMIKMDWIPVQEDLLEVYGNDISQMFMEVLIFFFFAIGYFMFMLITVALGRFLRFLCAIPTTPRETDILFTYLNNSLYSIAVIISLIFRCGVQYEQVKGDEVFEQNVFAIYFLLFTPAVITWSIRFTRYHRMSVVRRLLFIVISSLVFSIFFSWTSQAVTFLILGT
jgi:hypothetical protein